MALTGICSSTQQPEAEEEDSESSHNSESDEGDIRQLQDEEERLRFDERTVSSLPEKATGGGEMKPGGFTSFSFKKRSTGRPQIRQRTSELS